MPLLTWLKYAWHPANLPFVLSAVALGVVLLYTRAAKWGRRWLTAFVIGYWAICTPRIAAAFADLIASRAQVQTRADAKGATAIVVLGGGILTHSVDGLTQSDLTGTAVRLLEAIRVYRLLDAPLLVLSGGNTEALEPPVTEAGAMREVTRGFGIPDGRLLLEDTSLNTRTEAVNVKRLLAEHGVARFVLVTSGTHMPRALAAFRAVGLTPVPSAPRIMNDDERRHWSILPRREALLLSDAVVYELVATAYYRARGWLN